MPAECEICESDNTWYVGHSNTVHCGDCGAYYDTEESPPPPKLRRQPYDDGDD
jgi:hypothetical protein